MVDFHRGGSDTNSKSKINEIIFLHSLLQGDSGSPLTVEVEGGHTLVGLVSHGPGGWKHCGQVHFVVLNCIFCLKLFLKIMSI